MTTRTIEIFSAGCPLCEETVKMVENLASSSCKISVIDMHDIQGASRARELGVSSVPAVAVNGKPASCCDRRGPDAASLQAAGLGQPFA